MSETNRAAIALNTPLRLTPEEMDDPFKVFEDFFGDFDLEEVREVIWLFISNLLCLSDDDLPDDLDRSMLLHYSEQIDKLVEASFLICVRFNKHRRINRSKAGVSE